MSDRIIVMRNAEIAQQRPDSAMADEQNIARHALRQDRLCFADDPLLRVESALPATDALARSPEECIGDGFELLRWQEAGLSFSCIASRRWTSRVKCVGKNSGSFQCLALPA